MLSLFDNKYYKTGRPEKLVIFVHGYNGSPEDIDYAMQWLRERLDNAVLVVPRAPFVCEKNAANLQWLSFFKEDPNMRFRNPETPIKEIFAIFSRLAADFRRVAGQMNAFVSEQQKIWQVDDAHTYLAGFSQGAMITIYTALTRPRCLGGAAAIAGIVPGLGVLDKEICSRPPFLIMHGREDATVQYKTLPQTLQWFTARKIPHRVFEFDGLAHKMNEAEMQKLADFVNFGGCL